MDEATLFYFAVLKIIREFGITILISFSLHSFCKFCGGILVLDLAVGWMEGD